MIVISYFYFLAVVVCWAVHVCVYLRMWMGGKAGFNQGIATVFVDNLPNDIQKIWVYNLFSKFGRIRETFIPNKKSKITGQSFGFVRFVCSKEAAIAIAKTNGLRCWNHKLVVKFAKFLIGKDNNHDNNQYRLGKDNQRSNVRNQNLQYGSRDHNFHHGFKRKANGTQMQ